MQFDAFFNMVAIFWIIMDSVGCIPIYVALLSRYEPKKQRKIILREMVIALAVMILFLFFGEAFFRLLNVDTPSLQIAGGSILFIIAIRLLFSEPKAKNAIDSKAKEPLIVPLAIPSIAGPGILATITLYGGGLAANKFYVVLAIVIAWLLSLPFLLLASLLKKVIGDGGLAAIERLFGYLIALLAISMAINGFMTTFK